MKFNNEKWFKEHKIQNWTLLLILMLFIFSGTGWYYLNNQEMLNSEALKMYEKADSAKEIIENKVFMASEANDQVRELDSLNDSISEEDLSETSISDVELGM